MPICSRRGYCHAGDGLSRISKVFATLLVAQIVGAIGAGAPPMPSAFGVASGIGGALEGDSYAATQRSLLERVRRAAALAQAAKVAADDLSQAAKATRARRLAAQQRRAAARVAAKDAEQRVRRALVHARMLVEEPPPSIQAQARDAAPLPGLEASLVANTRRLRPTVERRSECGFGCNGHGSCNSTSGSCICALGFTGRYCDIKRCPGDCNGRGVCINARCLCESGIYGQACQHQRCPGDCSGRGYCFQGRCQCTGGWGGLACLDLAHPAVALAAAA